MCSCKLREKTRKEGDVGCRGQETSPRRGTPAADKRIQAKYQHWAKAGTPRTARDLSKVWLFRELCRMYVHSDVERNLNSRKLNIYITKDVIIGY